MPVEMNCPGCGDNRFRYPNEADAPVCCEYCGTNIGTYREIQQRISRAVLSGAVLRIPRSSSIGRQLGAGLPPNE